MLSNLTSVMNITHLRHYAATIKLIITQSHNLCSLRDASHRGEVMSL